MRFFRLLTPCYKTDMLYARHNPIGSYGSDYSIPTLICPVCQRWSSSDVVRKELTSDKEVLKRLDARPLHLAEWKDEVIELSRLLGIDKELLRPGTELGPPRGTITRTSFDDFLDVGCSRFWVKPAVRAAIVQASLIGIDFVQVEAQWDSRITHPPISEPDRWFRHIDRDAAGKVVKDLPPSAPALWELVVHGKAWRVGMNSERITLCNVCGRTGFPDPRWLEVDIARWDGSDFFHLDMNPNVTLVTEKAKDLIEAHSFSNIICEPVQ